MMTYLSLANTGISISKLYMWMNNWLNSISKHKQMINMDYLIICCHYRSSFDLILDPSNMLVFVQYPPPFEILHCQCISKWHHPWIFWQTFYGFFISFDWCMVHKRKRQAFRQMERDMHKNWYVASHHSDQRTCLEEFCKNRSLFIL